MKYLESFILFIILIVVSATLILFAPKEQSLVTATQQEVASSDLLQYISTDRMFADINCTSAEITERDCEGTSVHFAEVGIDDKTKRLYLIREQANVITGLIPMGNGANLIKYEFIHLSQGVYLSLQSKTKEENTIIELIPFLKDTRIDGIPAYTVTVDP